MQLLSLETRIPCDASNLTPGENLGSAVISALVPSPNEVPPALGARGKPHMRDPDSFWIHCAVQNPPGS